MFTYRLVNTSTIEGLHSSLGGSWIVVFDETVVETLALDVVSKGADVKATSAFVVDQTLDNLIGGSAYRHANKQKGYENRASAALLHNTTIPNTRC